MTYQVHFIPDDVTVGAEEGDNLIQTAMRAGVHINASCGGGGVCGKCRVILEEGDLESPRTDKLSDKDYDKGYRLACQSLVRGDLKVRVPVESQMDGRALERVRPGANAAREAEEVGVERLREEGVFRPPYVKRLVRLNPPAPGDNISDLTRLIQALRREYDIHNISVDFKAIKELPHLLREEEFAATVTLAYRPSHEEGDNGLRIELTDVQPGDRTALNYALAVDMGTTTVWVQLLDMSTGEVTAASADFNHQVSYGEDVLTRIVYSQKGDGLVKMQELAVATINGLIDKIVKKSGIEREDITMMTASGNTTMTQLLLGVDPKYLRLAPYVPTANYYPPIKARELGLDVGEHVRLNVFPAVASYVGGDIVSGVLAAGIHKDPRLTLFIDLGTNGEIVVGNQDWLACASCSAGPAFEGGGVKFGMRATSGAIEDFAVNPQSFEPMIITMDMQKPKGICGSGLINIVAGLYEMGVINEIGKFEQNLDTNRVREGDDGWEFVLSWAEETQIDQDIVLTEIDIENLIRAKAAMYAGFQCLMEGVGLTVHELERVIIAGGFGKYINLEKAVTIGLFPEMDLDKFLFIGNSSLTGSRLACLSNALRRDVGRIESMMTNFELSEVPSYMDYYVAAQFLPHTNQEFFPEVVGRVAQTRDLVRAE